MQRILVADNEPEIVNSMKEMLSPYYIVDIATYGFEVLKLCGEIKYDGIIMDIDFGAGINGIEIATLLREKDKTVKIIIFSAVAYSKEIKQKANDLCVFFFEKPIDLEKVLKSFDT